MQLGAVDGLDVEGLVESSLDAVRVQIDGAGEQGDGVDQFGGAGGVGLGVEGVELGLGGLAFVVQFGQCGFA